MIFEPRPRGMPGAPPIHAHRRQILAAAGSLLLSGALPDGAAAQQAPRKGAPYGWPRPSTLPAWTR
jgi:hypothetical protein